LRSLRINLILKKQEWLLDAQTAVRKLPDGQPLQLAATAAKKPLLHFSAAPAIGSNISHESPQEERVFMYIFFYIQIKLTHGIFHPWELK
jgi:hypothetical protein